MAIHERGDVAFARLRRPAEPFCKHAKPMHIVLMTELLEQAVKTARALPPELQDDIARMMLAYAGHEESIYRLTPEEEADLTEAEAEIERGEIASDAEVDRVFSKYRP